MTVEEALVLLDRVLQGQKLRDVQEQIFRYSWQGWTYPAIADHLGYDTGHIRDVGSQLWRQLSQEMEEVVTKKNLQAVLRRYAQQHPEPSPKSAVPMARLSRNDSFETRVTLPVRRQHWEEVLDVSVFYGRGQELALLQQWILRERCRLVTIAGMGGMGKTALAAKFAEQFQDKFDVVIWQSLRNAPAIAELLPTWIHVLSNGRETRPAASIDTQISQVMGYLRSSRCLLILDQVESILEKTPAGQYRAGYEDYEDLLRRIGSEHHASCLVLTSREKPKTLMSLEGKASPIRTLTLTGLHSLESRELVQAEGCFAENQTDWIELAKYYSGNPFALKVVATTVRDLFDGNITTFLVQGPITFSDIYEVLDEQFHRLSDLEKQVLYWLAVHQEWASLAALCDDFAPISSSTLLGALLSLKQRSLIEKKAGSFTLQPVVMKYVMDQLLNRIEAEVEPEVEAECDPSKPGRANRSISHR